MRLLHLIMLTGAAIAPVLPSLAVAQTAPGARPGDKEMTCEAIAGERADIAASQARRADAKAASAKRNHAAFGLLKTVAAGIVPGQALGLGGVGGQAAYLASGQAIGAIKGGGGAPSAGAPTPTPTAAETDRLARLQSIAAFRQCAA